MGWNLIQEKKGGEECFCRCAYWNVTSLVAVFLALLSLSELWSLS